MPHLQAAADSAPEGEARWSCLCFVADALLNSGRPDESLPFYDQAVTQARTAGETGAVDTHQVWAALSTIKGQWAIALREVGDDLDKARHYFLYSAEAGRRGGSPSTEILGRELEALRIDIMKGEAAAVLPQVEARLGQVEGWWQENRAGVAKASDAEGLARLFVSALSIAAQAHCALMDWESALRRFDAVLEVDRSLGRPAEEIARGRMNRANVLGRLSRFGEAKAELDACLGIFENDPTRKARVLDALAVLFCQQGDVDQAIIQGRRALALREHLPDPTERATSHHNLAAHLERRGTPPAFAESAYHRLAALVYWLVAGLGQHIQTSQGNYADRFRRARAAGVELAVPRVDDLLADPAFRALDEWLRGRQIDAAEVQTAVDQLLEQVREAAAGE